ncbi:hypothetical protein KR51_00011180 [Rubidibacter lacunae KORDI 51-2]|uniref:Uncharacterized protein n=1 Tax=Rubidibacter lacunae KORDI 51-2 TaxID=582515 RepID=U5DNK7_9CHRO|nr:hypothetical protein KR51_00011180 [Rubidibacter lacunae KORDI 51-2]
MLTAPETIRAIDLWVPLALLGTIVLAAVFFSTRDR